jgi:hypothetical protein
MQPHLSSTHSKLSTHGSDTNEISPICEIRHMQGSVLPRREEGASGARMEIPIPALKRGHVKLSTIANWKLPSYMRKALLWNGLLLFGKPGQGSERSSYPLYRSTKRLPTAGKFWVSSVAKGIRFPEYRICCSGSRAMMIERFQFKHARNQRLPETPCCAVTQLEPQESSSLTDRLSRPCLIKQITTDLILHLLNLLTSCVHRPHLLLPLSPRTPPRSHRKTASRAGTRGAPAHRSQLSL